MTEQIQAINQMIDVGQQIADNTPDWVLNDLRADMQDYIPNIFDDWELALVIHCEAGLRLHALGKGSMPEAISIPHESLGDTHPMHPYMEMAWNAVSHEVFGDSAPLKYEVMKT